MKKVALGMSGGVDSSTCAHMLIEQGYDVTGVYLECWRAPGCRSEEDRKDALKIALELGIPFKVLDFKKEYKENVVEYFFKEYESGRTPNPDVMCNKEIKFGMFYDWAMDEGFDFIATGHYAKVVEIETGKTKTKIADSAKSERESTSQNDTKLNGKNKTNKQLTVPKDKHKDQTYFLYLMKQDQVEHTLFPLADLTKTEVREKAASYGLHVSDKKDSVGICFIGDINVHEFLKDRLGENPGNVVDTSGNIIGKHKGLWFYTVGQRSGFTINAKTIIKQDDGSTINKHNIPPFYVIRKNADNNELVVGFGAETFQNKFKVRYLHWIVDGNNKFAKDSENLFVRIRHTGELLECSLEKEFVGELDLNKSSDSIDESNSNGFDNNKSPSYTVKLKKDTRGIAEGQSAVFYKQVDNVETNSGKQTICLGGGVIG